MRLSRALIFFIMAFAFIVPISIQASNLPQISTASIQINNTQLPLETPLLKKGAVLFFPLRDATPLLKASLNYSRKNDTYLLEITKQKIRGLIVPNSQEFWINKTRHLFSEKTFFYENRLYLPLKDFFELIGYTVTNKNNLFTIKKTDKKSIPASSFDNKFIPKSDKIKLPDMNTDTISFISLGNNKYNLNKILFDNKQIPYINLNPILKKEKISITENKQAVILKKNNTSYTFFTNSGLVLIKKDKLIEKRYLGYPVIKKGKTIYFPLISFICAFDYQFYWDKAKQELFILNTIKKIELAKTASGHSVRVLANQQLSPMAPEELSWTKGFYIDIPNTVPLFREKQFLLDMHNLSMVLCKQINNTTTRITFFLRNQTPSTYLKPTSFGAEMQFYPNITNFSEKIINNKVIITIKADSAFKYIKWSQPSRFIIDIPDAISNLPQIIRAKNKPYKRIRCSQFKESPPYTRIVFDYDNTIVPPSKISKIKNSLVLEFSLPKRAPTKTKPKPRKKPFDPSAPLKNKIIAIDPGHGGRDPGAIGLYKKYEKNYTIDISRRLNKLLTASGAFVVMLRTKDRNPSLRTRTVNANKNTADALISVHVNSFFKPFAKGTETYYYKQKDKPLAKYIQKEMVKELKLPNNGIKRARMYVLRNSKMPAALVEPLFITNPKEFHLLDKPAFRQRLALAIYKGIKKYFSQNP
jgi:N-acetylmuramoyl-L-alanine amidase